MTKLTLSYVISGYILEAEGRRLSPNTLNDYKIAFYRLTEWIGGDTAFDEIDLQKIRAFFAYLSGTKFAPRGGAAHRKAKLLSNKTLLNHHTALSALWTWAVSNGFADEHIIRNIPRPKPEKRQIVPFSPSDIHAIMDACDYSKPYIHRATGSTSRYTRPTAQRDKTMILLLVDTGIRASELCNLRIKDLDFKNNTITVTGKGKKTRSIPLSSRTWKSLWRYLAQHRDGAAESDNVFTQTDNRPLNRNALLKLIKRLGKSAGVSNAHPHRFRHTFAVLFLRNGGNVYALQKILGHSSLDMVKNYLALAEADVESAHRIASPVANMEW